MPSISSILHSASQIRFVIMNRIIFLPIIRDFVDEITYMQPARRCCTCWRPSSSHACPSRPPCSPGWDRLVSRPQHNYSECCMADQLGVTSQQIFSTCGDDFALFDPRGTIQHVLRERFNINCQASFDSTSQASPPSVIRRRSSSVCVITFLSRGLWSVQSANRSIFDAFHANVIDMHPLPNLNSPSHPAPVILLSNWCRHVARRVCAGRSPSRRRQQHRFVVLFSTVLPQPYKSCACVANLYIFLQARNVGRH